MFQKILLVDDDDNILQGYQRNLHRHFNLEVATLGPQAIQLLEDHGPFAVMVSDMRMPGMSGLELLEVARQRWPGMIRIMLTGNADQRTAMDAVNHGQVFRFLTKPCPSEDLALAIEAGLRQYHLQEAEKTLLEKTLTGSLQVLTDLLSLLDPESFGWAQIIRDRACRVALHLGYPNIWCLEIAALLAPIGKLTLPAGLEARMQAGGPMNAQELHLLERIPETGARLLESIPRLEDVVEIVRYQNKRYSGAGFPPTSLKGDNIPWGARILSPLQHFTNIERTRKSIFVAMEEVKLHAAWYDAQVIAAMEHCLLPLPGGVKVPEKVSPRPTRVLEAGMCLAADLKTQTGKTLIYSGTRLCPPHLMLIRDMGELLGLEEPAYVLET
ncbi:MAG: response regulator [Holophaga sp.]|nr:response regulator [Holophaga sp.]